MLIINLGTVVLNSGEEGEEEMRSRTKGHRLEMAHRRILMSSYVHHTNTHYKNLHTIHD